MKSATMVGVRWWSRYGRWILMGRRELDWADRFLRAGVTQRFRRTPAPGRSAHLSHCRPALLACPAASFNIYTFLGSWPWCFGLAWAE